MAHRLYAEKAAALIDRRTQLGISVAEVARRGGVARVTADRWFDPQHASTFDSLDKAAAALDAHWSVVVDEEQGRVRMLLVPNA